MNKTFTSRIRRATAVLIVALGMVAGSMGTANAVSVPSPGCMSASADFYSVDNSGIDRSFRMSGSLYKSCGTYAALQYKMNFGPGSSTGWKTGISKYTNGSESRVFGDNFYYSNTARGAWVRLCGYWSCSDYTAYVDNPYN
ncbi:MAG TPA: hypothetical protein VFI99_12975 [Nocardioides sp.]|nr:hypothetical protein [Nocardioides sp.]